MIPIKFTSKGKPQAREITPRRIAAAKRFLKRERDKAGLFVDEVARKQPTPEERIRQHDEWFRNDYWQRLRDHDAKTWRQGRAIVRSWPREHQDKAIAWFNDGRWPKAPAYFCDLMRRYAQENDLPWKEE